MKLRLPGFGAELSKMRLPPPTRPALQGGTIAAYKAALHSFFRVDKNRLQTYSSDFIFQDGDVMERHDWTIDEVSEIYQQPLMQLVLKASDVHRNHHNPEEIQVCTLVNIKEGGCQEDCKYCSQSSRYNTAVDAKPLMDKEEVLSRAREAKAKGVTRICLGAAWRGVRNGPQFDRILEMIREVNELGVEVCVTLGLLNDEQARKLKEAGLYAYNHNLDTSREYYKTIITTRTYDDRLSTLDSVEKAGISVCCGGILGLGESVEDRISMLHTLATRDKHPESVPVNRLIPVEGTPLSMATQMPVWEMIRAIATARILMPHSMVRLSAGRDSLSWSEQALCFLSGANSIHTGEKLLTEPVQGYDEDAEMFATLGLHAREPFAAREPADVCVGV